MRNKCAEYSPGLCRRKKKKDLDRGKSFDSTRLAKIPITSVGFSGAVRGFVGIESRSGGELNPLAPVTRTLNLISRAPGLFSFHNFLPLHPYYYRNSGSSTGSRSERPKGTYAHRFMGGVLFYFILFCAFLISLVNSLDSWSGSYLIPSCRGYLQYVTTFRKS